MVHQYLTDDAVNAYQPGGRFQIKADPDDTTKVMHYGRPSSARQHRKKGVQAWRGRADR